MSTGLFIPLAEAATLLFYQFLPYITIYWGKKSTGEPDCSKLARFGGGLAIKLKGLNSPLIRDMIIEFLYTTYPDLM